MADERELRVVRDAVLTGAAAPATPRVPIAASWRRVAACGLEPGSAPEVAPLVTEEIERRRAESGLADLVPLLAEHLSPATDAGQMMVVADTEGRVLWRVGSSGVRRMADELGFVGGSAWTEGNVGTNAIGTCLVVGEGIAIRGPEHFVDSHTAWGCAAAPVRDPWTGRTLGVVDLSGPSRGLHPAELGLVELAARMAGMQLVERRRAELDRVRAQAAPLLAGMRGDALAVDTHGHLAAAIGARTPERVALPTDLAAGRAWLPTLGSALVEPLSGGWLLRLDPDEVQAASRVTLDLRSEPRLEVTGQQGTWVRTLTPRHAELLVALVEAGATGRTAAGLAEDLFADAGRVVTVRAELSRLRRTVGGVLLSGPYRFSPGVDVGTALPDDPRAVLPGSSAPVVLRLRAMSSRGDAGQDV